MKNRISKYFKSPRAKKIDPAELLDLWKNAVQYSNKTRHMVDHFPERVQFALDMRIRFSSMSIVNNVAKTSNCRTSEELEASAQKAKDAVSKTLANLFVAKKWEYLRKDLFEDAYQEGKVLSSRLAQVLDA